MTQINNILIISEIEDFMNNKHRSHYSLTKGYNFAYGLAKIESNKVFYYTTGKYELYNNISFVNNEILNNNMDIFTHLILIRETNLLDILNIDILKNMVLNTNIKKIIKSDSLVWLNNKVYTKHFIRRHKFFNFIYDNFSYICCQTEALKKTGLEYIQEIFGKLCANKLSKKIYVSKMGVPDVYPLNNTICNPYKINHEYCVDNHTLLCNNKALMPKIINENFNNKKTILLYIGRIKTHGILQMMHDIMKKLGTELLI